MNILIYVCSVIISYLLGSFSPSLVFSKFTKKELRNQGSKNLGASNATIVLGWKYGLLVGLIDIFKGTIPVLLVRFLFPSFIILPYLVAAAAVLGHMYPFYLKFKGGKGFATYMGIILGLDWRFFIIIGIATILITLISNYIVLATLTVVISFPIYLVFLAPFPYYALILAPVSLIIIIKHRSNIKHIIAGDEVGIRSTFHKKKK